MLTTQISTVTAQIRSLQGDVTQAQAKLNALESQLAVHQQKLDKLNGLFVLQTKKLDLLRRAYHIALNRFERRLIDAYNRRDRGPVARFALESSSRVLIEDLNATRLAGNRRPWR